MKGDKVGELMRVVKEAAMLGARNFVV